MSLPLPFVEESIAELRRIGDRKVVRGVIVESHTRGWTVDVPALEAIYALCAERGLPIMLHLASEVITAGLADYGLILGRICSPMAGTSHANRPKPGRTGRSGSSSGRAGTFDAAWARCLGSVGEGFPECSSPASG